MRRLTMPVVTCAIVLALLGGGAFALRDHLPPMPGGGHASPSISKAAQVKPVYVGEGLKLPPRPTEPATMTRADPEPAQEPGASPPLAEASNGDPMGLSAKIPEPPKTLCTVDIGPWPTDRTNQVKSIQLLLRDLGFYSGTTYGTIGPATRAAIGKFQLAANEAETGEPNEVLFEALKKKCISSVP
jgi:hypothetical protein